MYKSKKAQSFTSWSFPVTPGMVNSNQIIDELTTLNGNWSQ